MRFRALLPVVLATSILAGCGGDDAAAGGERGGFRAAPRVITVPVELKPLVDDIEALGTARANESVDILPRISSLVERIHFDEGQSVKTGDLLVELESSEIVAGLALADASLSESRSLYERSKALASSQAISASNLEQLLAQVQANEAQVEAARARLSNTRILAPFAGRVGLRRVSPGSFVNSTTVITTLDDVSRIKLDFSIPETFLAVVSEGMSIVAESAVYPDEKFQGTVTSIDTRIDPRTRTLQVRAVLPNDSGLLKPGMFMTVGLRRDEGDVPVVPEQAIVPEGDAQYVFVVVDNVAQRRTVEIARRIPGYVVIGSGVDVGERVIAEGTSKVRDGSPVEEIGDADI